MTLAADAYFTIALFVGLLIALISGRVSASAAFGVVLLAVVGAGVVTSGEVVKSAANPGIVTLLLLLTVSLGLEKTQWLGRIAHTLIAKTLDGTLWRVIGVGALTSAFLNNTAVVATLLPLLRRNGRFPPGKLLLPLSFAAIFGGTMTLIGTSTNLVVNSLLMDAGHPGFRFFDFLPVGIAVTLACGLVLWWFARRLPERSSDPHEFQQYLLDAKVAADSPLVGKSVMEAGLRNMEALFLVELVRAGRLISPVAPHELIEAGDRLIFAGDVKQISQLQRYPGLNLFADNNGLLQQNLVEVMIAPNATIAGKTLKRAGFRSMFDAAVVAMRREGTPLSGKLGEIRLQPGDCLVLAVGPDFPSRANLRKNFFMLSEVQLPHQLSPRQEWLTLLGFGVVILLSALDLVSLMTGSLFLLGAMLLTGILRREEVARRFPFDLWLIVASALVLAQAMENSGLAQALAGWLTAVLHGKGVWLAFVGVYLVTALLTETMTNNAAAALVFPLAWGLAQGLGVNPMPFVLAVAYAASASFILPFGYQTNLMVFNAARYTMGDFWRVGLPVSLTHGCVVCLLLPYFFPF